MLIPTMIAALLGAQPADTRAFVELDWEEIMPGIEFAQAYGVRDGDGPHAFFVRFTPGTSVPHHLHNSGYSGVMLSGRMINIHDHDARSEPAVGDTFHFGSRRVHAHQCVSEEPCIFYTHWDGPFDLEPVDHGSGDSS